MKGFGNSASPGSEEVGCRKANGRNNSANILISSPPNVTAQTAPEEPKLLVSSVTPKLKSHLAKHKNDPINTSTGSSTSGVEISSLSSKSELPTGFSLLHPNARFPYQPSYDPNEFLSPEDFENPLFIYRSLSFRRAIEEGNFQNFFGLNVSSNSQCTLSQRTLQDCQDSLCFQISQDSGHPQSLSLGSSLSIDGRLQAPSAATGFATEDSRCLRAAWYGRQTDSFGSQEDPVEPPRPIWRSFTSEDSGCDPTQIVVTDANAEDPFIQSHLAVELR